MNSILHILKFKIIYIVLTKSNISNDKVDINEKNVFLNSNK